VLTRTSATWLLYALLGCLGFLINGLGAILEPLRGELGVTRQQVAFYPSLFSAGLLLVGIVGGVVVGRLGRPLALRLSIAAMLAGTAGLAVPARLATLLAAGLLGCGCALLLQLIPAALADLHANAPTAAVAEANAIASTASILAPLAVAGALTAGLGWRAGYLAVPAASLLALALLAWRVRLPGNEGRTLASAAPRPPAATQPGAAAPAAGLTRAEPAPDMDADVVPGRLLGRWTEMLLAVSAEFCIVFWAAAALIEWHHASASQGPAVAALFLVGMACARAFGSPITRLLRDETTLLLTAICGAAAGFTLFWWAPTLALAGAGLLVTGLGLAMLYPATVSRVIAAWPHAPDRAAARATLASGLGTGAAPYLLAWLAGAAGIRRAYLLVPLLLAALAVSAVLGRRRAASRPAAFRLP
jgi:fucose permease